MQTAWGVGRSSAAGLAKLLRRPGAGLLQLLHTTDLAPPFKPVQHLETTRSEPRGEAGHQEGSNPWTEKRKKIKGRKSEDQDRPGRLTSRSR